MKVISAWYCPDSYKCCTFCMLISMFLNVLLMVLYTRQMLLTSIVARQRVNDRNRRAEQREGPREGVSPLIFNTLFSSYIVAIAIIYVIEHWLHTIYKHMARNDGQARRPMNLYMKCHYRNVEDDGKGQFTCKPCLSFFTSFSFFQVCHVLFFI